MADPIAWTLDVSRTQLVDTLWPTLIADPSLWGQVVLALVGFVLVGRSWALSPFVAAIAVLPLAYLAHPQFSEAPRIMAPIWVSLSLGVALVFVWVVLRVQGATPGGLAAEARRGDERVAP